MSPLRAQIFRDETRLRPKYGARETNLRDRLENAPLTSLSRLRKRDPAPRTSGPGRRGLDRGLLVFISQETGCIDWHGGRSFREAQLHDVGTGGLFVTPPLTGLWAPRALPARRLRRHPLGCFAHTYGGSHAGSAGAGGGAARAAQIHRTDVASQ